MEEKKEVRHAIPITHHRHKVVRPGPARMGSVCVCGFYRPFFTLPYPLPLALPTAEPWLVHRTRKDVQFHRTSCCDDDRCNRMKCPCGGKKLAGSAHHNPTVARGTGHQILPPKLSLPACHGTVTANFITDSHIKLSRLNVRRKSSAKKRKEKNLNRTAPPSPLPSRNLHDVHIYVSYGKIDIFITHLYQNSICNISILFDAHTHTHTADRCAKCI